MNFTVRDVMNLEVMNFSRVLTLLDVLEQRPVESISVIEIPVENFVRKNEFVLTTGIGCGTDSASLLEFISDIIEGEAAAVAISTGRHIFTIPDNVIQFANKRSFPIIEIPWEIRFSDITQSVLTALNSSQRMLLQESTEIRTQILHLVLNSSSLSDIANFVSDKIAHPVIVVDRHGEVIAKSSNSEKLLDEWMKNVDFGFTTYSSSTISSSGNRYIKHMITGNDFLKIPIRSSTELQGYFIISIPPEMSLDASLPLEKAYILEHASTAAALTFLRTHLVESTKARLRSNFVWNLANGEIDSWEAILSQSEFFGYNVSPLNVCLLVSIHNLQNVFNGTIREVPYDNWSDDLLERLEENLRDIGRENQYSLMTTHYKNQFVIFLGMSNKSDSEISLNSLIEALEIRIKEVIEDSVLSWGIGNYHEGCQSFHKSYTESQLAIDLGDRKKGRGHRTYYTEVSLNEAFVRLASDVDVQKVTDSVLGRLLAYDQQKGMDLVETLRTYLRNQGNVSQTSRDINLHRQTLIYRLHKIESLTNRSLVDADDLFLLDLSLRLILAKSLQTKKIE